MIKELFRDILSKAWNVVHIQMPFQNIVFVWILICSLALLLWLVHQLLPYFSIRFLKIIEICLACLLLPSYLLAKRMRRLKYQPLSICYHLEEIIVKIFRPFYVISRKFRKKKGNSNILFKTVLLMIFSSGVIIPTWYFNSDTRIWWYQFNGWITTGKWQIKGLPLSSYLFSPETPDEFVIRCITSRNINECKLGKSTIFSYLPDWKKGEEINIKSIKLVSPSNTRAIVNIVLEYSTKKGKKRSECLDISLSQGEREWSIDQVDRCEK